MRQQRLPINQSTPEVDCPPLALRLPQAAKLLGLGPRSLWEMVRRGVIPHARIGNGAKKKLILFPLAELRAWLAEQARANSAGQ
jgi:excisionase family DNA binding protein